MENILLLCFFQAYLPCQILLILEYLSRGLSLQGFSLNLLLNALKSITLSLSTINSPNNNKEDIFILLYQKKSLNFHEFRKIFKDYLNTKELIYSIFKAFIILSSFSLIMSKSLLEILLELPLFIFAKHSSQ